MSDIIPEMLSVAEAALKLRCHVRTVLRLISKDELEAVRVSRKHVLVTVASIAALIERRRSQAREMVECQVLAFDARKARRKAR
jgi:excisionase family DNA binding protein